MALTRLQSAPCIPLACGHRLRSRAMPLQMLHASRTRVYSRSRRQHVVQAAASGFSSEEPYKVLGLREGADSESVQRQYNKLKREKKGDESAISAIENAHSSLMMRNLTMRMQGGVSVAKDIKYADKAQYLPWRPRLYRADNKVLLYSGIAQALLTAWALLLSVTAGTQPVIASAVVGGVGNVYKINQIFPPSSSSTASEEEKRKGLRNILRGCLLAFLATFAGCFLFFTLPDLVASKINKQLPYWFYANEKVLLCVGTTLCNTLMTAFFR
ncbi:hypothetical protein ABBQ38_004406 [Trebouxia sp. C0009 RCD-2024]